MPHANKQPPTSKRAKAARTKKAAGKQSAIASKPKKAPLLAAVALRVIANPKDFRKSLQKAAAGEGVFVTPTLKFGPFDDALLVASEEMANSFVLSEFRTTLLEGFGPGARIEAEKFRALKSRLGPRLIRDAETFNSEVWPLHDLPSRLLKKKLPLPPPTGMLPQVSANREYFGTMWFDEFPEKVVAQQLIVSSTGRLFLDIIGQFGRAGYFKKCGRALPTEGAAFMTDNSPCEYFPTGGLSDACTLRIWIESISEEALTVRGDWAGEGYRHTFSGTLDRR